MRYKRVVVKIGTSVLAKESGIDTKIVRSIALQVSKLAERGTDIVLVSSGAIGAGMGMMKMVRVPQSLSELQAIASIGQNELMRLYSEAFKEHGKTVGQILLTQDDFDHRRRYLNIKYTIDTLLSKKVIPIVNENDSVSTEEIKCGDNDRLSSLVADLSEADALLILSDVDGLYDKSGKVMSTVEHVSEEIKRLVVKKCLAFTKGGMATKIEAAERCINSGMDCLIANGRTANIVLDALDGRGLFTHFKAKAVKKKARKRWIAYSSKTRGKILVDDGAKKALEAGNKSLLATGIIGKVGTFKAGDVTSISDSKGNEFARGLTNYSSNEIDIIKGLKTSEIASRLGYKDHDEVVHRDNLVIM